MAEVRTSSQSERPCAGIEETRTALGGAGGSKDPGQRKVHSLIDKVYAPANLAEAWRHVRDNKGGPASTASPSPPSPTGRRNAWPRCTGSCATGATDPLR